jgi:hypothetical protein
MITSLLNWWTEQMRDLVPASLRLSGQTWRRALIVVADPSDAAIAELFLLGPFKPPMSTVPSSTSCNDPCLILLSQ